MSDVIPVVLGFDFRCYPSDKEANPLTIDVNEWPQVDGFGREALLQRAASTLDREETSLISPLDMSMLVCLPRTWLDTEVDVLKDVVVVAFASLTIGLSRQAYRVDLADGYYGCEITYAELLKAGWVSLGFDVCDDSLSASLLYSGQKGLIEVTANCPGLTEQLNSYGLFLNRESASAFSAKCEYLMVEHSPFSSVEVLVKGNAYKRINGVTD
ncbi:hypothetical protein [Thiobacillus sp.]|uniref:hypothetical protein n=1 Tax=Thiobacillus sp. TaxID=924 RepID=UPI0025FFDE16|nr:hypothetical protein [Thiobacillus sp.]MBT9539683.1 hypothetical protein [Thiobacillus sp.]